jgi:hypothetical protein
MYDIGSGKIAEDHKLLYFLQGARGFTALYRSEFVESRQNSFRGKPIPPIDDICGSKFTF